MKKIIIGSFCYKTIYSPNNVPIFFTIILGFYSILLYEPDLSKVSHIQYQSYRYSILSADTFRKTHSYLAVPSQTSREKYSRFEDITSDDAGYTVIITWLIYLNIVQIDRETIKQLYPGNSNLDETRKIMRESLSQRTAFVGPTLYFIAVIFLTLVIIYSNKESNHLTIFLLVSLLLFLPIHAPQIFVERLHSHSLIAACIVLALISGVIMKHASDDANIFKLTLCLIFPGLLLGIIDIIRHSQGIAVLAALFTIAIFIKGSWKIKLLRLLFLIIGLIAINLMVDVMRTSRDASLNIDTAIIGTTKHPYVHTLLSGISQYPNNSLGANNESEVISLIRAEAGEQLQQDSLEYLRVARKVFINYLKSHPLESIKVILYKMKDFPKRVEYLSGINFNTILLILIFLIISLLAGFFIKTNVIWFIGSVALILSAFEIYIPAIVNPHFAYGIVTAFIISTIFLLTFWLNKLGSIWIQNRCQMLAPNGESAVHCVPSPNLNQPVQVHEKNKKFYR